jgi:hypothetical protein
VEPKADGGFLATYELRADGRKCGLRDVLACIDSHSAGAQKKQSGDKRGEKPCVYAHASNDEVE